MTQKTHIFNGCSSNTNANDKPLRQIATFILPVDLEIQDLNILTWANTSLRNNFPLLLSDVVHWYDSLHHIGSFGSSHLNVGTFDRLRPFQDNSFVEILLLLWSLFKYVTWIYNMKSNFCGQRSCFVPSSTNSYFITYSLLPYWILSSLWYLFHICTSPTRA